MKTVMLLCSLISAVPAFLNGMKAEIAGAGFGVSNDDDDEESGKEVLVRNGPGEAAIDLPPTG
jgi:hypothetical protein